MEEIFFGKIIILLPQKLKQKNNENLGEIALANECVFDGKFMILLTQKLKRNIKNLGEINQFRYRVIICSS